jgi:hypothetical protein
MLEARMQRLAANASANAAQQQQEQQQQQQSFRFPSRSVWLSHGRPFRAFLEPLDPTSTENGSAAAKCALLWRQGRFAESPLRNPPPPYAHWLEELLEASLDAERVLQVGPQILRALQVQRAGEGGDEWQEFLRRWNVLGVRVGPTVMVHSAVVVNVPQGLALLEGCLQSGTAWDVGHLLAALKCAPPFSLLHENWTLIVEHSLDVALLRAPREHMAAVLRSVSLWDAARFHDPPSADATTLAQAERLQPQWNRIAALFAREKLPEPIQASFWMARSDAHAEIADLDFARAVSPELEVRHLLAEGDCPWKAYQESASTADGAARLLQRATGTLAARDGGKLGRATKLCTLLGAQCSALEEAKKALTSDDALLRFASHYEHDAGWAQWAKGELLRMRAGSNAAETPELVVVSLAASGQVGLAREWAAHFRPDPGRVSQLLGKRYVDALNAFYPKHVELQAAVSLASPSSRGSSKPLVAAVNVSMSDADWADYVSVGGTPRVMGDMLMEALRGEPLMVCAVELCVRGYACYTMACYIQVNSTPLPP